LLVTYSAGHPSQAWYAALCAIAGSLLGSAFLFGIARKGGEVFLARHISKGAGRRLHAWFVHYGLITVFLPAVSPLPLPLKVPVFCAGALDVRWGSFLVVVLAARAIRYFALAALGIEYGARTFTFLHAHMEIIVIIAASLAAGAFVFVRIATRRKHHRTAHPASAGGK
jgi:membrane protein YqaA with SNARE-associated domain